MITRENWRTCFRAIRRSTGALGCCTEWRGYFGRSFKGQKFKWFNRAEFTHAALPPMRS